MTQLEKLQALNTALTDEMPQFKQQAAAFKMEEASQFRLFRSLVNLRPPKEADPQFIELQDSYLQTALSHKGITDIDTLSPAEGSIYLWQGDITTLRCGAIVNAANSEMLGCFIPCHGCIDNAIHTYAGMQLRLACYRLMQQQGHPEPTGRAKITPAFNLPSSYIVHTVGPIVQGHLTTTDCNLLRDCYNSCLTLADRHGIDSIAFCCISTGEFHFPAKKAAEIALQTVRGYLNQTHSPIKVIFNVYKDTDFQIYRELLG